MFLLSITRNCQEFTPPLGSFDRLCYFSVASHRTNLILNSHCLINCKIHFYCKLLLMTHFSLQYSNLITGMHKDSTTNVS